MNHPHPHNQPLDTAVADNALDEGSPAQAGPATRDLRVVIEACDVVEAELRFQAGRLDIAKERARSEEELAFLQEMAKRYARSASTVNKLRRYHEARRKAAALAVEGGQDAILALLDDDDGIDEQGRARAFC